MFIKTTIDLEQGRTRSKVFQKKMENFLILREHVLRRASLVAQQIKNLPANIRDTGSTPGSGRSPGERNSSPLQYSCLENPLDREAWRATVHGVTKSQTQLGY